MKSYRLFEWLSVAGIIFIYCLLMPSTSYSQAEKIPQIAGTLKKYFPEISAQDISESQVPGIFQVTRGPSIVYVTQNGRYIFSGDIIDLDNQFENITEQARKKARVTAIDTIRQKDAIIFPAKNPKHTVTVFTDLDCGYCRKFHQQIKAYNDKGITVQYLAFPRTGPDTESYKKAVSVWCSENKNQALTLAKQGKPLNSKLCDTHHVYQQFQMGILMGVQGTPTIILEDGFVVPGYLSPDGLEKAILKEEGQSKHTKTRANPKMKPH